MNENEIYFETIKCFDNEVFNLEYHKKRIVNTIGLNIELDEYIYPINDNLLKCKVIYNQDGIIDISYMPYIKRKISKFKIVINNNINYDCKNVNREAIDKLYNCRGESDDIIIVKNNYITDTSIANIAILIGDIWYTPKQSLLYGTTKQRYLDIKKIIEKDITVEILCKAKKIALMNAMIDFDIIDEFSVTLL